MSRGSYADMNNNINNMYQDSTMSIDEFYCSVLGSIELLLSYMRRNRLWKTQNIYYTYNNNSNNNSNRHNNHSIPNSKSAYLLYDLTHLRTQITIDTNNQCI